MNDTVIDRDEHTVRFQRRLRASREAVFDAWTDPERISEWWDPSGARLRRCEVDLRPGGAFSFENVGHGPPFAGVYRVVERPSKLVFEALGAVGTVLVEADGDGSLLRVAIRCASAEHLEQFVAIGVDEDTGRTLDNLVSYLESPGAARATS